MAVLQIDFLNAFSFSFTFYVKLVLVLCSSLAFSTSPLKEVHLSQFYFTKDTQCFQLRK